MLAHIPRRAPNAHRLRWIGDRFFARAITHALDLRVGLMSTGMWGWLVYRRSDFARIAWGEARTRAEAQRCAEGVALRRIERASNE